MPGHIALPSLLSMHRTPDLVTEIHRLASRRGWSQAELARQLGVSRSTLVHARGGRRWFTTDVMARISRLFGDVPTMKDLVWSYVRYDFPAGPEEKGILPLAEKRRTDLPGDAVDAIRRFVRSFPMRLVDGHGLVLTGGSARMLSLASRSVADGLASAGVRVHRRAASDPLGPTESAAIGKSRLLVLERIDGASDAVVALLESQLAAERPVVLTSAKAIDTVLGQRLARLLRSRTTLIRLDSPSSPTDD